MSKYKVGDKVILTVSDVPVIDTAYIPCYMLNDNFIFSEQGLDEYVEPLSTYTEPLEAKIKRQAAEITRLLAENKRLKAENGNVIWEIEQAFDRGCNAAWELAKKCMLMTDRERETIFGSGHNALYGVLTYFDYKHAAAKVAEWEKAKEGVKVGDVYMSRVGNYFVIYDIDHEKGIAKILWSDLSNSARELDDIKEYYIKTGRHIDIDGFLKQIGEK